jgi:TrmH family RNA methyltransferase
MSLERRITSRDNPLIRRCIELATSARERRRSGATIIEGIHLVQAWMQRHGLPQALLVSDAAADHPEVKHLLASASGSVTRLSETVFRSISGLTQGIGVLAIVDAPRPALPARWTHDVLVLDRIQDPGNVGTLIRTCAAVGISSLVTLPGTALCWSPKVLRAAMGAHFALEIHEGISWGDVAARWDGMVIGTRVREASSLYTLDLRSPALWVLGNEGEGLSPATTASISHWVSIPQTDWVESLNVAVAGAVCLFEQRRQRLQALGLGPAEPC